MDKVTTIAVDTAKSTFSLFWVDAETGEIGSRTLTRGKFGEFLRTHKPSRFVLEACGGAHHWARTLREHGHEVRLIAPTVS